VEILAQHISTFRVIFATAITTFLISASGTADAQRQSQIFDTEIENTIRLYATPVLRAAGLEPNAVRVHIVRSNAPNAFVAKGQRIFLTTELLTASESPGQLIGVLAHETGHIAGGHLARLDIMLRDAQSPALLSNVLGAVIGVLAGDAGAAAAVASGGQMAVIRNLLSFTRTQERSADRAAVVLLERTRQSSKGLLEFLEYLDSQQALIISRRRQQELSYDVTHPLTRERMAYIRDQVGRSRHSARPSPAPLIRLHDRMRAKLKAFLNHPGRTLREYREDDRGEAARYARAIAYYRGGEIGRAIAIIDGLIGDSPDDPYFLELKGQILFENGRIAESIAPYEAAVRLLPRAPLLRIGLAHAQIELNETELLDAAVVNLEEALRGDRMLPFAWRLAATAYGRKGRLGRSSLASAEYNLMVGRFGDALRMADRARRILKRGAPGWLRAGDVINAAKAAQAAKAGAEARR